MATQPIEINLAIRPKGRFEIVDVASLIREQVGEGLNQYRKAAYCSFHTTAGYLEQAVCARLGYSHKQLAPLIRAVQKIFPHDAGYFHDRMQLREELSDSQKEDEPINGDSHLTFIGAGLNNCVLYLHHPHEPVYFIELDGMFKHRVRQRRTTVMAYSDTEVVQRGRVEIPVSDGRAIEAFNLKDPRYGLFAQVADWCRRHGVEKGYIDIRLAPEEKHVGMTVNEYETLLMRNDLPQALIDPLRFALQRGNDVVQLYNYLMAQVPVGRSVIDRVFAALSTPAKRILRLKRHIRLLVSDDVEPGADHILHGTYQSPILVQYYPAPNGVRRLNISLHRFI